jgi:GTP-binding protein YchF
MTGDRAEQCSALRGFSLPTVEPHIPTRYCPRSPPGGAHKFMLKAGIVGLPNVGKSTLFNAVTRTRKAEAANYPFCTIDPNVGIVTVPDARLAVLKDIAKTTVIIPAAIEFVDIAGLVKGASAGEGLGNKFLTHIREVDAIVQVVRCFDDENVIHVAGTIDPVRDIEIINTELVLADLEAVTKRLEKVSKDVKRGDKIAIAEQAVLQKFQPVLNEGKPGLTVPLMPEEKVIARGFYLLTDKPTIFACNVKESDLATADQNAYVAKVREYVKTHLACEAVVISAQIESDLVDLSPEEAKEFLKELGVQESGVGALIRATYHLLGLRTYFTAGEKEVRAWTIHVGDTAPKAAGVIHSDFERGFIKAETVAYDDLVKLGSVAAAREKGLYRMEGKEYVVKDGDVLLFKFNV